MKKGKRKAASNAILSTAIYAGLAALVRLAERRGNRRTKKFQMSIQKKWEEIRSGRKETRRTDPRDFSIIQNAEPNLRKMCLQMLWYSTKPYGNKEFKRVYSWESGTVGPLNALLNYAGARLREIAVTRYPFPEPVYFQIRKYEKGVLKVLSQRVAESYPDDSSAKKVYWKAGYRGNSKHPRVLLTHPTLPGLDFVDMIRAHVIELCRQCFIHGVPRSEAHRYIRLLIHNLRPFLDWVYTGGESGRKNFFPDADKELRIIVLEIRALYGRHSGRSESITRLLDDTYTNPNVDILKRKALEILNTSTVDEVRASCAEILDRIDQGLIVDRDVAKLIDHVNTLAIREGNEWHRVMLSGLHHPFSLSSVVFHGDSMLTTPDNVLVVGGLPVTGRDRLGKTDIVYFVRRSVSGRVVWTPIMILEVKTKTSFDFNIYAVMSKSKRDYLPKGYAWKRALDENDWKILSTSHPDEKALTQLEAYEQGILQEYRKLVRDDPSPPTSLWKGVVIIDTDQSYAEVYDAFQMMLGNLAENIHRLAPRVSEWTSLTPDSIDSINVPRVAVLLSPSKGPSHLIKEKQSAEFIGTKDPFEHRIKDDRIFTLYVSVASSTSYGEAAAWVSKNWHLINHIRECVESSDDKLNLVWLDLLGDFPSEYLLNKRLGLDQLYRERAMNSMQYRALHQLLGKTHFINLSVSVREFLFESAEFDLDAFKSQLNISAGEESIIIVDGWSGLNQMIPTHRRHLLRVLECALLDTVPESRTNVIWIDNGAPHSIMNPLYQRRCVRPLPHDSPRGPLLDEVIYNFPLTPRVFGWQTPREVDLRVIAQDTPTETKPWSTIIRVPQLRDWARIFRGVSKRIRTVGPEELPDDIKNLPRMYGRQVTLSSVRASVEKLTAERVVEIQNDALTLAPSLLRPRDGIDIIDREPEEQLTWIAVAFPIHKGQPSASYDRLGLEPNMPPPTPSRSDERYFPLGKVTRGWAYGSIPDVDDSIEEWTGTVRRPPLFKSTERIHIDSVETREHEVIRLLNAAQFLKTQVTRYSDLEVCCDKIISICRNALSEDTDEKLLLMALEQARKQILGNTTRRAAWRLIERTRKGLDEVLNSENRLVLQRAINKNDELLTLYGNNLFLAVFAVADEILQDTESPAIIDLWSAIAEWQLYQMGFRPDDIPEFESKSRYDFQAIYSNLKWRGKQLSEIPQAEKPRFPERLGQIIQKDTGDGVKTWLVFQERGLQRYLAGQLGESRTRALLHGWYRCEIDPEELSVSAKEVLGSSEWEREPVTITNVNGFDLIYQRSQEDDEWRLVGVLEYGRPPKGKGLPVRWLRFSQPPSEVFPMIHGYTPRIKPLDLDASVNSILKEAAAWSGKIREVTCRLTIDPQREVYRIDLLEGSKNIAKKETPYTDEVVRFLRHPLRTGEYFETNDSTLLKWDVQEDIEYDDVKIVDDDGSKKWISLSFLKPLLVRSSFFPDSYLVPSSCKELLSIKSGDEVTMGFIVDERLKTLGVKKYLKVRLEGLLKDSAISHLESERLGIFDVALLAECSQLIDVGSGHGHDVNIDAEGLLELRVVNLLNDYPRISSVLMSLIESLEESDTQEEPDEREIVPSGPSLKFLSVSLEHRIRSRMIDVVALLFSVEVKNDVHEVGVFRVSSEIAKSQSIAYDMIDSEVRKAMRSKILDDDEFEKLLKAIVECLEKEGIEVGYY
ncbi:MAG: hypothetical protein ACXADC_03590 [Candidatus Thorarchaeota archaeon]